MNVGRTIYLYKMLIMFCISFIFCILNLKMKFGVYITIDFNQYYYRIGVPLVCEVTDHGNNKQYYYFKENVELNC